MTVPGSWGRGRPGTPPLRLAVLGDSSAAGLGCQRAEQTPGALLAGGLARELQRRVLLDVQAVVGARARDLDTQVARALARGVDLTVIMIGANDVTHRTPITAATRRPPRRTVTAPPDRDTDPWPSAADGNPKLLRRSRISER